MYEPTITAAEEIAADNLAARWLIDMGALADVLSWTFDNREIAAELDVSVEMVEVRAAHLHPAERHYLRRRMAQREAVA